MKELRAVRRGTWVGVLTLALTAGVMARRAFVAAPTAPPEELRDAVASPAPLVPLPAARPGAYAFKVRPAPRPLASRRLDRLADALDARAASLRAASEN